MADYTDYQQRAFYGAGQAAQRAGQRFHMERDALRRGDKDAAKYHRSRANALNRQGAYAAVRGMGGNEGPNQYFPVTSSGQPIQGQGGGIGLTLSSAGRDVFDKFRQQGFVKPIREKKRYAPNTEPKGVGYLMDKIASNTIGGKILSSFGNKKPKPDDAYYKSLYGQGLNEMYSPSGIFTSGDFLGEADIDPYYKRSSLPKGLGFLKPFIKPRGDAFDTVRSSNIPEDLEFMQETPRDYSGLMSDDLDINEEFVAPDGIGYSPYLEEVEETDLMAEALKEVERQALKDQIMANPATPNFGNLEGLYGIKANTFDPEQYVLDNPPEIQTGIIEGLEPSSFMQENEIIQKVIKENPFMLEIMGNDYKGIRAYLFDIGILDPDSDLYGQTSNLENVKPIQQFMIEMVDE